MQNLTTGLHRCAVTKQLDLCVQVCLGHINTEDQGSIEVWANLSEMALLSLRDDCQHPEAMRPGCTMKAGECCITGKEAWCISALVAIVPEVVDGQPTGREALINACLSLEGIALLLEHLKQEAKPINFIPMVEAKNQTPYMWTVTQRGCDILSQLMYGQPEHTWGDVRHAEIEMLIVEPRDGFSELPTYRLNESGFERLTYPNKHERLSLPMPDEPFAFVYYRRVTVTVFCEQGTGQPMRPRIVQVLGWRVGDPDNGLVCELGVEEDGGYSIYRRGRLLSGGEYVSMLEDEFDKAMTERRE